jgi:hypothetical protein
MIYEQSTDTFWTHDFFLDLKEKDIITDYTPEPGIILKTYPNVWKNWKADTSEHLDDMYEIDVKREVKR